MIRKGIRRVHSTLIALPYLLLFTFYAPFALSVDINVTSTADILADDGVCTLREAVIAANENFPSGFTPGECPGGAIGADTILLTSPGIYQLSILGDDEDLARTGDLDLLEDVTIEGSDADTYAVNAGFLDRAFHNTDNDTSVTIRKLTVTGGRLGNVERGGGLYNNGTLLVEDAIIASNQLGTAGRGAGIYHVGPLLTLRRTVVRNNQISLGSSTSRGGGAYLDDDDAVVEDCLFQGNVATDGGGIFTNISQQSVIITGTHFINNQAVDDGGAIYSFSREAVVSGATFSENTAESGGGIFQQNYDLIITNSTFNANTASANGGGLYVDSSSDSTSLQNVTFDEGYSSLSSAIYAEGSSVTISNSIIAGRCDGVFVTTFGGNIEVLGNTCGLIDPTDVVGATSTAVNLEPLKDNGGKTPTQLPGKDSIAIEGGNFAQCTLSDQRGVMRPQDFDGVGGSQCDVGAVELKPCPHDQILTLDNDTISGTETYEGCEKVEAGDNFIVADTADVVFRSGHSVGFSSGFTVQPGATVNVEIDWAFWETIP